MSLQRVAFSLHPGAREHLGGRLRHVLAQLVLVGLDVALPRRDLLLVAHPDRVGHLLKEPEVVGDEDDAALECLDRGG